MNTHSVITFRKVVLVLIGVVFFQPIAVAKHTPQNFQVIDGVAIHLGIMPAEILQSHPKAHPEGKMHGGVPTKAHRDHVVVALIDNTSGKRIENAEVTGRVTELGLASQNKKFEVMKIADTITYGYYFKMPSKQPYHIQPWNRIPGRPDIEAIFTHRHF